MKKDLYIPIEILSRELDSKILIILDLLINSNNEWSIYLGNIKKIGKFLNNKKKIPFVWFDKGVEVNELKLKKIIHNNGRAVLLDEEGGIKTKKHDEFPRGLKNNPAILLYSHIFFWGRETSEEWMKNHTLLNKNKTTITGNPRFDLSKIFFRDYFKKINLNLPNYNYIIISTAFGNSNRRNPINSEYSDYWNSINKNTVNKIDFEIAEYQQRLFKPYIDGIKNLINDFPDLKFILRPHPSEKKITYEEIFKNDSNIQVISDRSIQDWLPNAITLIHNGCTTAIEGFFHGLNPICYAPIKGEGNEQYATFKISHIAHNYIELKKIFQDLISKKIKNKNEKKIDYIKKHINNFGDINAYSIISKKIDSITFDKIKVNLPLKEKLKILFPNFFYELWTLVIKKYFSNQKIIEYKKGLLNDDKQKFPKLELYDLRVRFDAYLNLFEKKSNIKIKCLDKDLFRITINR